MAIIDSRGFNLVTDGSQFNQGVGGIINQLMSQQLQKRALQGDEGSLATLAGADPRRANAVGGILQNRQQMEQQALQQQAAQKQQQQEMMARIARGYSTAQDKSGFLAAAADQLESAGMADMAAQVREDLDAYAQNPAAVDQEYTAALSMFGRQQADQMPAGVRELEYLTQGMTPEEQAQARRVATGLAPRAAIAPEVYGSREAAKIDARRGRQADVAEEVEGAKVRGRASAERQANAPKAAAALRSTFRSVDNVIQTAEKASDQVNVMSAGAGGRLLANFSGTKATDLRKTIDTLKAALSFDTLQEMRNNSPTGGALGAISERELDLLGATVASIDADQSPAQLKANIEKVIDHYNNYKELAEQAYNAEYQPVQQESAPAQPSSGGQIEFLGFE